jgi:ribonucleoside-diphosphate reductase alpha chain
MTQHLKPSSTLSSITSVRKRNGNSEHFDIERIRRAISGAFKEEYNIPKIDTLRQELQALVDTVTDAVLEELGDLHEQGEELNVERIQDTVETRLMKDGYHSIARRYIVYREEHKKARQLKATEEASEGSQITLTVEMANGVRIPLNLRHIRQAIIRACHGYEDQCPADELIEETLRNLYDGVKHSEIFTAMILAARSRIERDPAYSYVSAHLLLDVIYNAVFEKDPLTHDIQAIYCSSFKDYISKGIDAERLDPELQSYDLEKISAALCPERDRSFAYLGLQAVYDRYLLREGDTLLETPQYFWMRVSMGLALREGDNREERAIEFYNLLSQFYYTSSTPTLFNAGTTRPQLSSCYLSTVGDDLENIFKVISDNAQLSKWAGGLGNDWTSVRATGSRIKGTNGKSQGVIPFLKVANDTAVAVNQGGKRKGALCSYLETWHLDIEDFIELRRNTGDERRRTHDMNTANWIPDLFMKRVKENASWTLFSPCDVPDLHDLYGTAFEKRYCEYEALAEEGKLTQSKKVNAMDLWRRMLTMVFETGHPWITFKDPSNIRSPQSHQGVVHCSNLCTEILLNTSREETAVCNLGSINLPAHITDGRLDEEQLETTIKTAMRMLDNVIDINYYPTDDARRANLRHRPVGLGIMGTQDALYKVGISYASKAAVEFADESQEIIAYYAILASTELAKERGAYSTFKGSKWDQGYLPLDTVELLEKERGGHLSVDRQARKDWTPVREAIKTHGMRNSNTMAIAPTATISNITGVSQSIEPTYSHLFTKSNLSGEFAVLNTYLVQELKSLGMWDQEMVDDLKYFDGSIQEIERIPEELKERFRTAFEVEPKWLIEAASRRQKWIDMGQSLNLYLSAPSGKKLSEMYLFAWEKGLKTTYYLRSLAATSVEKSSMDINRRGIQPRWMKSKSASSNITVDRVGSAAPEACSLLDPDCESCQ